MEKIKDSEILFIVNPNSGTKDTNHILKAILENKRNLSVVISEKKDSFDELIENYLSDYKVFVAVGGDGTVNTIAAHLTGFKDKILAVFPTGSGNGFAKEMGFDSKLEDLLHDINQGVISEIDVLEINNKKFVNVAGIGFDAAVAHRFHSGDKRGFLNYVINSIKTWFTFKPVKVELIAGDIQIRGNYFLITFANTRQFGNNAIISPKSDATDGLYEIILVKSIPFFLLPIFVLDMFRER